jgi:hypothetical protein
VRVVGQTVVSARGGECSASAYVFHCLLVRIDDGVNSIFGILGVLEVLVSTDRNGHMME